MRGGLRYREGASVSVCVQRGVMRGGSVFLCAVLLKGGLAYGAQRC